MKVIEDHYIRVELHRNILEINWLPSSRDLNDRHFQHLVRRNLFYAKDIRPQYWLEDTRTLQYLCLPEMQLWAANQAANIFDQLAVKKLAIVLPDNPTLSVLVAETVVFMLEKQKCNAPVTRFFASKKDAVSWLVEGSTYMPDLSPTSTNMGFA